MHLSSSTHGVLLICLYCWYVRFLATLLSPLLNGLTLPNISMMESLRCSTLSFLQIFWKCAANLIFIYDQLPAYRRAVCLTIYGFPLESWSTARVTIQQWTWEIVHWESVLLCMPTVIVRISWSRSSWTPPRDIWIISRTISYISFSMPQQFL